MVNQCRDESLTFENALNEIPFKDAFQLKLCVVSP